MKAAFLSRTVARTFTTWTLEENAVTPASWAHAGTLFRSATETRESDARVMGVVNRIICLYCVPKSRRTIIKNCLAPLPVQVAEGHFMGTLRKTIAVRIFVLWAGASAHRRIRATGASARGILPKPQHIWIRDPHGGFPGRPPHAITALSVFPAIPRLRFRWDAPLCMMHWARRRRQRTSKRYSRA